ncbi:DivIVA domain-containing protein [Nocardioides lijunqiniae]|uniref:DivIVA domain-containing protein n=1 Tax=Nocardioides lijunqiniae TaxID=2760832 RepID=UPI001D0CD5FB|nr:DivIVA domain-containing protein [Nocardioides lijunqiniae]
MALSPHDIESQRFTPVRLRHGYEMSAVDELLDEACVAHTALIQENDDLEARLVDPREVPGGPATMRVMRPEAVREARFEQVRWREGYDIGEVDDFLAAVEASLRELHQRNDALHRG